MATPEETRDRIKEMRDRIFKEPDKDSVNKAVKETPQKKDLADKKPEAEHKDDGLTSKIEIKETPKKKDLADKKTEVDQQYENLSLSLKQINSLEANFSEKFQQSDDKISLLSADTQKELAAIALDFASKSSSLETVLLDKMEHTFAESNSKIDGIEHLVNNNIINSSQANKALQEELNEFNNSLQLDIAAVTQKLSSENKKIEVELKNSDENFTMFKNSVDERQSSLAESFSEKLQQLVNRFSSSNQKLQTELKNSDDKLSKFENSVEERQNSLEESFSERFKQSDNKISLLSTDTQKNLSELAVDFESKNSSLETVLLDKLEHISFHLKKVEEQIESQVDDLSTSVKKFVLSITTSQEEKIDAVAQEVNFLEEKLQTEVGGIKALVLEQKPLLEGTMSAYALASNKKIDAQEKKIQKSIKSLKQEIFEFQRDLKTDFDKNIKERELKTNDYLSKRIFEVRELLSGEVKSLSGELTTLNDVLEDKHSKLATHVDNNVSAIKTVAEKDHRNFSNQFEKVSNNIQSLESMIVKEEDLVELFQNYTLNVNITDNGKPSKK